MAEHKTSNVLAITLLAGLAGAGLALLMAPRSGQETRNKIQETADDIRKQAEDNLEQAKVKMRHNSDKLKAWKEHVASKAVEKGEQAKENFDQAINVTPDEINDFNTSILKNWEEEV